MAVLLAGMAFFAGPLAASGALSPSDASVYSQAFAALENKSGSQALSAAQMANDKLLYDVVYGLALGLEDSGADFTSAANFLMTHPFWHERDRKAILRIAEPKIDGGVSPQTLLSLFTPLPPQTGDGFMRYYDALVASGQSAKANAEAEKRWREDAMGDEEQRAFLDRFRNILTFSDHVARLDHLLWEGAWGAAENMYPLLSEGYRDLARARMALNKGAKNAAQLVAAVPRNLQGDSGLLYERARYRRKKDDDSGALEMLQKAHGRLGNAEKWWEERHIQARNLMDKGDMRGAYNLVSRHGLTEGTELSDAEFLAGWLALRYLGNAPTALQHFTRLNANATSPITSARAGYWMGRALEELGRSQEASSAYARAAVFGTTYYGQLAAARVYANSNISASAPAIPQPEMARFEANPHVAAIRQLMQIGQRKIAERMAIGFAQAASREVDFRLMANLALQLQAPEIAVKVAKQAAKKKIMIPVEGYPVLLSMETTATAPLAHAIMRQESEFDAGVTSKSDARGLMQLLPSTAKHVVRESGISADADDLYNPDNNVKLGTAYIEELLGDFNGSLPLAIASYNAGPGRVRQWLDKMGDPRGGAMDPIDWIERIPFNETRNYVQRVMEALQIYRAKFSGGTVLLNIHNDLRG